MEKNYFGNAWEENNSQSKTTFFNVALDASKVEACTANAKGYVSFSVSKRKSIDEKSGATHVIYEPLKGIKDDFSVLTFSFLKDEALNNVNDRKQIKLTISPVDKVKSAEIAFDKGSDKTFTSDWIVSTNPYKIEGGTKKIIGNGWDQAKQPILGQVWEKEVNGQVFYNASLPKEKLESLQANEKGFVNLTIGPRGSVENEKSPTHNIYKTLGVKDEAGIINISVNKAEALKNIDNSNNVRLTVSKVPPGKDYSYKYFVKSVEFGNTNPEFDKNKAVIGNGWDRSATLSNSKQKSQSIESSPIPAAATPDVSVPNAKKPKSKKSKSID